RSALRFEGNKRKRCARCDGQGVKHQLCQYLSMPISFRLIAARHCFFGICYSLPCEQDLQETFTLSKNLTPSRTSTGTKAKVRGCVCQRRAGSGRAAIPPTAKCGRLVRTQASRVSPLTASTGFSGDGVARPTF